MHVSDDLLRRALATVLSEVLDGAGSEYAYLLNRGDAGLLRALDALSAEEASAVPAGGTASVAAHAEHLRYGLSLLNRWAAGEAPFEDADWAAAWEEPAVTESEWADRRAALRAEAAAWQRSFHARPTLTETELTEIVASAAHLAYHLGAIRQIAPDVRGPSAAENAERRAAG